MSQVDQSFTHVLVQVDRVGVLHELAHHFTVLVLDDQHLFWFRHSTDHDVSDLRQYENENKNYSWITSYTYFGENWTVELSSWWQIVGVHFGKEQSVCLIRERTLSVELRTQTAPVL